MLGFFHRADCRIAMHGSDTKRDRKRMAAVNLRCVDGLDLDARNVTKFDEAKP
jgi:hypothetical protein